MTSLFDAETALRNEVASLIVGITPNHQPRIRFREMRPAVQDRMGNTDKAWATRIFEIKNGERLENYGFGSAVRPFRQNYTIEIRYLNANKRWNIAAQDDVERIIYTLSANQTTAAGVEMRMVDTKIPTVIEKDEDNNALTARLTLTVWYSITGA